MQSKQPSAQNLDEYNKEIQHLCSKIDFLFLCMSIHSKQFFALTENYVDHFSKKGLKAELYNKNDFFELIDAKDSYADSVNALRKLIIQRKSEASSLLPLKFQFEIRHQLVLRVAADIKAARRFSRLLRMYSATRADGNGLIKRWKTEVNEIKLMKFLEHS